MRFYIPKLGDEIILEEDWTFTLYNEHRNDSLWKALKFIEAKNHKDRFTSTKNQWGGYTEYKNTTVTIKAGCLLSIDRIYIRQGQKSFNSITFNLKTNPDGSKKTIKGRIRFWAKLADCNKINCVTNDTLGKIEKIKEL